MKIKTIVYQKIFPIAQYVNEKIGVEVEVNEGEDPSQLFEEAKFFVESCHKPMDGEAMIYAPSGDFGVECQLAKFAEIQVEKPQSTEEKIITQINECSDITVHWKLLSVFIG